MKSALRARVFDVGIKLLPFLFELSVFVVLTNMVFEAETSQPDA